MTRFQPSTPSTCTTKTRPNMNPLLQDPNFAKQADVGLARQQSKSDSGLHARPAHNERSSSEPREDLVFRTGIQSKGRPKKTAQMGCPAQPGQRKGKDYVDSQATLTDVDGLNSPLPHRGQPKKRIKK